MKLHLTHAYNLLVNFGMIIVFTLFLLPTMLFLKRYLTLSTTPEAKLANFLSAEIIAVTFLVANSLLDFFICRARDETFREACRYFYG